MTLPMDATGGPPWSIPDPGLSGGAEAAMLSVAEWLESQVQAGK